MESDPVKVKELKRGTLCPLHRSFGCACHARRLPPGSTPQVRRIEDKFHSRGYREICSPSERRRRKHVLLAEDPRCWICVAAGKPEEECRFRSYSDVVLEHKEPKGMGGARTDDHFDNLGLAHALCNLEKGSRRIA
jgi:hypothetical protein